MAVTGRVSSLTHVAMYVPFSLQKLRSATGLPSIRARARAMSTQRRSDHPHPRPARRGNLHTSRVLERPGYLEIWTTSCARVMVLFPLASGANGFQAGSPTPPSSSPTAYEPSTPLWIGLGDWAIRRYALCSVYSVHRTVFVFCELWAVYLSRCAQRSRRLCQEEVCNTPVSHAALQ